MILTFFVVRLLISSTMSSKWNGKTQPRFDATPVMNAMRNTQLELKKQTMRQSMMAIVQNSPLKQYVLSLFINRHTLFFLCDSHQVYNSHCAAFVHGRGVSLCMLHMQNTDLLLQVQVHGKLLLISSSILLLFFSSEGNVGHLKIQTFTPAPSTESGLTITNFRSMCGVTSIRTHMATSRFLETWQ